jgi:ferredoxin
MIKISSSVCNTCGLCIKVCHENCLAIDNNALTINYTYCSTCTQCIAICPKQAISWNDAQPMPFNQSLFPDPEQIKELLMERRTITWATLQLLLGTKYWARKLIFSGTLNIINSYQGYRPNNRL